MPQARIVVVGSTNQDLVLQVPAIPRPGETVLGGTLNVVAGGKGANQAVAAARLGAQVTFVGRVGADVFGAQAERQLAAEGLDTAFLVRDDGSAHGVAMILVEESGENAIAVAPGANARLTPADVRAAEPAIAAADCVLLQLEVPLDAVEDAAGLARRHGKRVILNPAPYLAMPDRLLALVDVLTPNETEAEMLLGGGAAGLAGVSATAQQILARGVGVVIVTLGREGVMVVRPGDEVRIPGRKVRVVDTTAAGDAFSGALAVFLAEGADLLDAVRKAVAASALCVTRLGAQPSLPTRAELEAFTTGPTS